MIQFSKVFTAWLAQQAQHNSLSLASFQIGDVTFDIVARSIEKTNLELLREAEPMFGRLANGSVSGVNDIPGTLTLIPSVQLEGQQFAACMPLDGPRVGDEIHFRSDALRIFRRLKGAEAHAWLNDLDRKTLVERLRYLADLSKA